MYFQDKLLIKLVSLLVLFYANGQYKSAQFINTNTDSLYPNTYETFSHNKCFDKDFTEKYILNLITLFNRLFLRKFTYTVIKKCKKWPQADTGALKKS